MTTPAMQPTSSASSADERAKFERYMQDDCFRDLQELTINANGNYDDLDVQNLWHSWRTAVAQIAPASQSIVPPVVQAPTNEQLRKVLHKYSRYLGSDHHSDTEFASLQDVMAFAREVMTLAAPIVATVPSEPTLYQSRMRPMWREAGQGWTAWVDCSKGSYEDITRLPSMQLNDWQYEVRRLFDNAAPSTVLDGLIAKMFGSMSAEDGDGDAYYNRGIDKCIQIVQATLKSATPADKGNAPAEGKL